MLKRILALLAGGALCFGGVACEHKKTQAELQAEKVRVFRIRQKANAAKAYQDIVTKFPDSEFAPQAKERLQQLGPVATPAKPAK